MKYKVKLIGKILLWDHTWPVFRYRDWVFGYNYSAKGRKIDGYDQIESGDILVFQKVIFK